MKTNYVLIDYESVQPDLLAILNRENFKVIIFVGANQNKITFDMASVLQHMGDRAQYIKIAGTGPNALDFHIAFYIGHISVGEPDAFFHIVSKDTGFDPLIKHLKSRKILACRSKDVNDIPLIKADSSKSLDERMEIVLADLERRGAARPRTLKTLTSTIASIFKKQITEGEIQLLLEELEMKSLISITDLKVNYQLAK